MDIAPPPKRPASESIVPMINVVFLLLIFFLMTSQIAPPDPVDITAPLSGSGTESEAEIKLFLDDTGTAFFGEAQGDAAMQALADMVRAASPSTGKLLLSADRNVEAAKLAALLRDLAAFGFVDVELSVRPE